MERNLLQKRLESMAVEQERTRIARDLHDGLGAQLAAVAWGADALALEGIDDPERLRELSQRARNGLADLRHIVSGLKAEEMDLATVAGEVERRGRLLVPNECTFSVLHQGTLRMAGGPASQLELMIRESVRNAVQHARPRAISVVLREDGEAVHVSIDYD